MSALTLNAGLPAMAWPNWHEHSLALGAALVLHVGLGLVLLNLSRGEPMTPALPVVIKTQLVSLPAPAPVPVVEPAQVVPAPKAAPVPKPVAKKVEQADLALKRVEQARQQRQREETQQREQMARDAQQRQAQQQEQERLARQAEAQRQAQAAAVAAEQAASRQYLPIDKRAPDYPHTALDRRIEGECTVTYTVNAQGRVEDPQVFGTCHPLFIKPSLAAAKTFRYQPRVVNGKAVAVANVKNTFSYRIKG